MGADGVLILSHCGFSFVEDLIAATNERKLQAWILSSLPAPEDGEKRLHALREKASILFSTASHELTRADIDHAIASLHRQEARIWCCISVWEGYRTLMAYANALLGVPDLEPGQIESLRDKQHVRNELVGAGLSRIRAVALTPKTLEELKHDGREYFIKPVRGIASYGAFRLRRDTSWAALQNVATRARKDTVYRSAFGEEMIFFAEDYLSGTEFSFEVIVSKGISHFVGIHEKCHLTETGETVLEDSCTSPPFSISPCDVAAGIEWVRAVFGHFGLEWGCFHVEARFDGDHWDLIEINPRIGGSLISHSVRALNGEASVLDLWLGLLLEHSPVRSNGPGDDAASSAEAFETRLERIGFSAEGIPSTNNATFFRVYFARPGRIDEIVVRPLSREPALKQILLKAGDEVGVSSREVFLGQILWKMTLNERNSELQSLLLSSEAAFDVRYEMPEPSQGLAIEVEG